MMSKQDANGVRTAQDIERKYDLSSLLGVKKAVERNEEELIKTNAELENFMKVTLEDVQQLQQQIDGSITTYFYSGAPTLNNLPASEWETTDYCNHLGDLYYDNDTGKAYRFVKQDDTYLWLAITDNEVTEALELAHKAQDTADNKRRVFLTTPFTPYDSGDLWLNNDELYVCCSSRATGSFNSSDFRKATKYTDDTALNTFISGEYADDIEVINTQIDKKAETWYQSNDPAVLWSTEALKKQHVGDLWYNTTENKNYLYDSTYKWIEIDGVPDSVYDKIDTKAQIFSSTPTPPYYVGDLYVQGDKGDIYVCIKERLTGSYNASEWEKASKYTDDTQLVNFLNGEYSDDLEAIHSQIDMKAETWYQNTDPATNWTTTDLKKAHVGDLWYDTTKNKNFIYTSSYVWQEIDGVPDNVYDEIDGKAQIFTSQPKPPYHIGDMYSQGATGDILVCKTERLTGSYNASDWQKASKYTDDSSLFDFVNTTYTESMKSLTNQIDAKVTTWYYEGVPTLSNNPASSWTTNEEKLKHTGDLYYDKSTGKAYIFQLEDNVYRWEIVEDQDAINALALANAASDTADSKRRVFLEKPIPPYDNGDLWLNNEEIYVCQISKGEGETFEDIDFIIATKYTDDTEAKKVGDNLEVLRGTVLKVQESVDEYKIQFDTSIKTIHNETKEMTETLETMSYSFGTKDLVINNSKDPVNTRINNQGLKVYSYDNLKQVTNHNGVGADTLIVTGEAQIGNLRFAKSTDENNKPCTEIHHLISNIQDLSDLE